MSSGRLFQNFGPTEPNERSPTVTRRDGRTSSWLEVADRRRRRDGKSATRRRIGNYVSTLIWAEDGMAIVTPPLLPRGPLTVDDSMTLAASIYTDETYENSV